MCKCSAKHTAQQPEAAEGPADGDEVTIHHDVKGGEEADADEQAMASWAGAPLSSDEQAEQSRKQAEKDARAVEAANLTLTLTLTLALALALTLTLTLTLTRYAFLARPADSEASEEKPDGSSPYLQNLFEGWSPEIHDILQATQARTAHSYQP